MTASTKVWCKSETDVAGAVVEWLRNTGWQVYQEVENPNGRCIDIVAQRGPLVWALEAKRSLNLAVLDQAYDSIPFSHLTSVVVPRGVGTTDGYEFGLKAAKAFGIGVLEVWAPTIDPRVTQAVEPAPRTMVKGDLAGRLTPAHKVFVAAGSSGGSHWTPFRQTSALLRQLVHKQPGILMTDAVKKVKHHYSNNENAAVELRRAIEAGIITGIRIERVNDKRIKLWASLVGGKKPLTLAEEQALRLQENGRHTAHPKTR